MGKTLLVNEESLVDLVSWAASAQMALEVVSPMVKDNEIVSLSIAVIQETAPEVVKRTLVLHKQVIDEHIDAQIDLSVQEQMYNIEEELRKLTD